MPPQYKQHQGTMMQSHPWSSRCFCVRKQNSVIILLMKNHTELFETNNTKSQVYFLYRINFLSVVMLCIQLFILAT